MEYIQKAIKTADVSVQAYPDNVYLFIYILDEAVYYYEKDQNIIENDFLVNLIQLTIEQFSYNGSIWKLYYSEFKLYGIIEADTNIYQK